MIKVKSINLKHNILLIFIFFFGYGLFSQEFLCDIQINSQQIQETDKRIPMTTNHANMLLKRAQHKHKISVPVSTHTLRKTFGRRIYDKNPCEDTLIKLSEIYQHRSVAQTRVYLGLRREELDAMYLDM